MSVEMEKRFMYMFMGLIRNIDKRNEEWIDAYSALVAIARNLNDPDEIRTQATTSNRDDLFISLLQAVQLYASKRNYKFADFKLVILYIDALCYGNLHAFSASISQIKSSEELRLNIVLCLKMIFINLSDDVLDAFYNGNSKTYAMMCQLISTCLDLAEKEKLRTLRISALECVMAISQLYDDPNKPSKIIQFRTAELLANILPGVSRRLYDICKRDEKQGHQVTTVALRCWGRFITRILDDNLTPAQNENIKLLTDKIELKKRDSSFYESVAKHLEVQAEGFTTLSNHSHPTVRLEVAKICELFINTCIRNIEPLIKHYISTLIKLSGDDYNIVRAESTAILGKFLKCHNQIFIEIIENLFHQFLTALPRLIINSVDEKSKVSALTLLCEYLRILNKSDFAFPVMNSIDYLNCLLTALITIVEFDVIDLSLLEDYSFKDINDVAKPGTPWKKFRYLNDESFKKLIDACNVIGAQLPNNGTIINLLLERFQQIHVQRKEITLLLNSIVGTASSSTDLRLQIIENILEMYIQPDNWYLPIKTDSESIREIKGNVVQVCLLAEGVGMFARSLGASFDKFMRHTLYLLLERAGSTQTYVCLAGMNSINMIKNALNYANVTDLLLNNGDYLRYHIIKQLRHVEYNPEVLDVLGFIMRYSTIEILPCIEEIISDALVQSLDKLQYRSWVPFIRLFHVFIKSVNKWLEKDRNRKILLSKCDPDDDAPRAVVDLAQMDEEYAKLSKEYEKREQNMTAAEMYVEDYLEEQQMQEASESNENGSKPKPPIEIQLTADIMKRCVHFLPSKDQNLKILTIDVLTVGVVVLQDWEDVLLPLVHLIWSPLVGRFTEISHPLIVERSVILLHTMVKHTDTFLGRRTLPQLHILMQYLTDLAPESLLKDNKSAYRYTQRYKLQLTLLKYVPEVVKNLQVRDDKLLNELFSVATPYLSNRQPKPLQENCLRFYKLCTEIDKNMVAEKVLKSSVSQNKEFELNLKVICSFVEFT